MKLKTHSGAKKRIKITGTGKYLFDKTAKRHLLSNKSKRAKGRDKYGHEMHKSDTIKAQTALPYGR